MQNRQDYSWLVCCEKIIGMELSTPLSVPFKILEPTVTVGKRLTCFMNSVQLSLDLYCNPQKNTSGRPIDRFRNKKTDVKISFKYSDLLLKDVVLVFGLIFNHVSVGGLQMAE